MFADDSKIPITSLMTILANAAHAADHVLFKTCDKRVLCQHIYLNDYFNL